MQRPDGAAELPRGSVRQGSQAPAAEATGAVPGQPRGGPAQARGTKDAGQSQLGQVRRSPRQSKGPQQTRLALTTAKGGTAKLQPVADSSQEASTAPALPHTATATLQLASRATSVVVTSSRVTRRGIARSAAAGKAQASGVAPSGNIQDSLDKPAAAAGLTLRPSLSPKGASRAPAAAAKPGRAIRASRVDASFRQQKQGIVPESKAGKQAGKMLDDVPAGYGLGTGQAGQKALRMGA